MSKNSPILPATRRDKRQDTRHGLSRGTFKKVQHYPASFQSVSPCYVPNLKGSVTPSYVPPSKSELAELSAAELERRYPGEATVHRGIVDRCNKGYASLDPRFKTLRDFLFHILTTIGPRPGDAWSLDRIDPDDKRYAPELVRWADPITQQNNKTTTITLPDPETGEPTSLPLLARKYKQQTNSVRKRLSRGWTVAEALVGKRAKTPSGTAAPASNTPSEAVPEGNPWPHGISAEKYARPYQAFLRDIPPVLRPQASRAIFIAALLRYRLNKAYTYLDYHWSEWRSPGDYDYVITLPVGKCMVDALAKLASAEAIIPDTRDTREFRALLARHTDWLTNALVILKWLRMKDAAKTTSASRTTRTYPPTANRPADYEAEDQAEDQADYDTDDQDDTEDQREKPGGIDPLHAEMYEPESERLAPEEAEGQPVMPWRSRNQGLILKAKSQDY